VVADEAPAETGHQQRGRGADGHDDPPQVREQRAAEMFDRRHHEEQLLVAER
jgi:hypothetical protein